MKKFYTLIFLFFISTVLMAQRTYVPDNNFEQALINQGYDDVLDDYVLTSNINSITNLDVSDSTFHTDTFDIRDLAGIEDFIALESLDCTNNLLTSFDLSSNVALQFLTCSGNDLISLDVSSNTNLERLDCRNNNLNSLDLSANRALIVLDCQDNGLTSLDLSYNILLEEVSCNHNDLTSINLSYTRFLKKLECYVNELTSLDLSYSTDLEFVNCNFNKLTSLDLSSNTDLEEVSCGYNELGYLGLPTSNTEITYLSCRSNNLTSINLNSNRVLESLYCDYNELTSLNLSSNTALEVVNCDNNNLTSLDLSSNTALEVVSCAYNELSSLGLPTSNKVKLLYCVSNNLTSIDLSSNIFLVRLLCSYNELTSLDLSAHSALTEVNCDNNNLTSLNVKNGNNTSIANRFHAQDNPNLICIQVDDVAYSNAAWPDKDVTATYSEFCSPFFIIPDRTFEQTLIDLGFDDILDGYVLTSNISSITKLDISNKVISDLTGIENFSALETLYCKNNKLTALDLSLNTSLKVLDCSNNKLENLNLKNGNNFNFTYLNTTGNANLICIEIDKINYCNVNWKNIGNKHFCIDKHTQFSESCEVLSINKITNTSYKMYPNPTSSFLNIEIDDFSELKSITIFNNLGQLVSEENKTEINVSNYSKGMYFAQIETTNGKLTKRFMVE